MPKLAQLRTAIYARVSTLDQDPRMQLRELRAYAEHRGLPSTEAFIEDVTGATAERRQLDRLWQAVRARKVDAVLVWKFDRFARSTKQLIDALEECRHLGVAFIAITEQIDTASPVGKAMFTVNSAIAEFERSLISERLRAGIAKAPANGKPHGRPTTDEQTIQEIRRRRRQGERLNAIARPSAFPTRRSRIVLRKKKRRPVPIMGTPASSSRRLGQNFALRYPGAT
jgi:DNA invertase Pin-like site-specific DNA recombinase